MKAHAALILTLMALGLLVAAAGSAGVHQPIYGKPLGSVVIFKHLTYNVTYITTITKTVHTLNSTNSTSSNSTTTASEKVASSYLVNYNVLAVNGTTITVSVETDIPKNTSFVNNGTYNVNPVYSPLTPQFPMVPPQYLAPVNWTNFTELASITGQAGLLISGRNVTMNLVNPSYTNSSYSVQVLVSTAWKSSLSDVTLNADGYLISATYTVNKTTVATIKLISSSGQTQIAQGFGSPLLSASSSPILYAVKTFNPLSQSLRISGYLQAFVPYVINNHTYLLVYYPLQPSGQGYVSSPQLALGYPTYVFETLVNITSSPSYIIPNPGSSEITWSNTTMKLVGVEDVNVLGNHYTVFVYSGLINGTQNVTLYVTKQGLVVKEYVVDLAKGLPALELDYLGPYLIQPTQTNPQVVMTEGPYTTLPFTVQNPKYFYVLTVVVSVVIVVIAVIVRLR